MKEGKERGRKEIRKKKENEIERKAQSTKTLKKGLFVLLNGQTLWHLFH